MAHALTHITPAVSTLNRDKARLTTALAAMNRLGVVATKVINADRTGLATNLALLRPALTKLAEAGKAIPDSLPLLVSFPFPITTLFKAVKGDYMNLFETLDISVSSIRRDFLGQLQKVGQPDGRHRAAGAQPVHRAAGQVGPDIVFVALLELAAGGC